MSVDHGRRHIPVAQEFLDGPDVRSHLPEGGWRGPGIHMKRPRTGQGPETGDEVVAIRVIAENGLPHESTGHDMM